MSSPIDPPLNPQEEATRSAAIVLVTDFPGSLSIVITVAKRSVDGKAGCGMSISARLGDGLTEDEEAALWQFVQAINEAARVATSEFLAMGGAGFVRRDESNAPASLVSKVNA